MVIFTYELYGSLWVTQTSRLLWHFIVEMVVPKWLKSRSIYTLLHTVLRGDHAWPFMVLDNVGPGAAHLSILAGYSV